MSLRASLLMLGSVGAFSTPALAQGRSGDLLDRLLPEIRASHPGKLVDAEYRADQEGRAHYHIRWITPDGVVLEFDTSTSNDAPRPK